MTEKLPRTNSALRPLYFFVGCVLLAAGVIGYFVPLMPGTVFLILAAGCFARSSRRLENWLLTHPRLGPSVIAWRTNRAIPRKAKIIAIISMAVSFTILLFVHLSLAAIAISGGLLAASALFVGTRPGVPARLPPSS
jgi:uncharacterized protein